MAAVSGWLPACYGAAFALKVDFDNVPALAEEREALWRRIADADFLSDGEKRPAARPAEAAGGVRCVPR